MACKRPWLVKIPRHAFAWAFDLACQCLDMVTGSGATKRGWVGVARKEEVLWYSKTELVEGMLRA